VESPTASCELNYCNTDISLNSILLQDELLLTSALIRYQLIMKHVFPAHQELFGKTVRDRVNSETSGNYYSLLMEVMETVENMA